MDKMAPVAAEAFKNSLRLIALNIISPPFLVFYSNDLPEYQYGIKELYEEKTKSKGIQRDKGFPGGFNIGIFWKLLFIWHPRRF